MRHWIWVNCYLRRLPALSRQLRAAHTQERWGSDPFAATVARIGKGREMKALWMHRYGIASLGLALLNLAIVLGSTTNWFWGAPLVPGTEPYWHLARGALVVALSSMGFGGLALGKERPRLFGIVALALSWLSYMVCVLRMAV
jgi:hypothetical protein